MPMTIVSLPLLRFAYRLNRQRIGTALSMLAEHDRLAPQDEDVVRRAHATFARERAAHRDYAISGSKIRLFLFADRLELYSPSKLPNTIMLDDMPYRTFTRNQLLVSFLSRIRSRRTGQVFLESRGEGVRKILRDGEVHSGRRPEYALFGDELRLTLWAKGAAAD